MADAPAFPAIGAAIGTAIDAGVELLPDVPVSRSDEDLLGRAPVAARLCELACAEPAGTPRVVALAGGAGAGKSSVLNLAAAMLQDRAGIAFVKLDGTGHAGAREMIEALLLQLMEFFSAQDVVDTTDAVRDTLARYGGVISGVARIAGVKVDLGGALARSADDVRAEIAEMTQEIGTRIVILLDHIDRLPGKEMAGMLVALRHIAAIPYVSIVLTYDRRAAAMLPDDVLDQSGFERLVPVELGLPSADRVLLARVLAGGLARLAARTGKNLDDVLPLCDPDSPDGSPLLDLCETPRDTKRAINALAASLPLVPADADIGAAALDIVLRLQVPVLDSPRLDQRTRVRDTARAMLLSELDAAVAGHRLAGPARAALRALFSGTV
ncbi:MAG TPA: P-loop NTPase fold protein [Kofleriaceae bacterium]|nr:P-loop NTPase fold protein [Kofleriaceae bacterium]